MTTNRNGEKPEKWRHARWTDNPFNFKSLQKDKDNATDKKDDKPAEDKGNEQNHRDAIRGSLIGGAAGDALGYPVEFMTYAEIIREYSSAGVTEYSKLGRSGKALISDDTQMTLFTANGILFGATRAATRGISPPIETCVHLAYLDWLTTQTGKAVNGSRQISWLAEVKELQSSRAPGITCISALQSGKKGSLKSPINTSKGCGGVMRVAPVALYSGNYSPELPLIGAKVAALTHGHSLGYIPAAALVQIIHRIVYGGCPLGDSIYDIAEECKTVLEELFAKEKHLGEQLELIDAAVKLSRNNKPDAENIAQIGQGWVGEEAFAIALYCSLKYYDDFSAAIIAAVNHDGDSDSTGAITGNIVGAYVGYSRIPDEWKTDLELHDTILEIADDLHTGCRFREDQDDDYGESQKWLKKYLECKPVKE